MSLHTKIQQKRWKEPSLSNGQEFIYASGIAPKTIQDSTLFNVFINYMDDGLENLFITFQWDLRLGGSLSAMKTGIKTPWQTKEAV